MRKCYFLLFLVAFFSTSVHAQRFTDKLSRGLVAVPTGATDGSKTNFVSWRRFAEEYYGVTYNLYRDGALIASGLTKSCYDDGSGLPNVRYQVAAVVNGVEQEKCDTISPWTQYVYNYVKRCPTGYIDIPLKKVYDRNGNDVTDHYEPNDVEVADLDGDGEMEIIVKRLNTYDAANIYPIENTTEFVVLDAYDVDWHTGKDSLLWRIDCGPNMVSQNSTEINIIAYDWDEDGKAEVVLRGADNMIVYGRDGKKVLYTIGDMNVNTRNEMTSHTDANFAWTRTGKEYLLYLDGNTGALWQKMDYPLTRESADAWGLDSKGEPEGYGHRSSKYFFGAPFLDGQKASLFLARGIYARHKMMALDLNSDHTWSTRWTWNNNTSGSPWYGQGYHNFVIADVDEDGRDEIVYGSMVIDDTGKGLSTTGLGHGDAQHVGDFDPYRKGLEFFGCNEDKPGMNYRNATTSQIYLRTTAAKDDGRALIGNFSNSYPGSLGRSVSSGIFSSVTDQFVEALASDTYIPWSDLNFRIYWDGDLCSEILNSPGTAREAKVDKPGLGRLFTSDGCNMNNDSKNNPCFQGDIIGDWREELILRCGGNLRVYTTGLSTDYDLYTLWHDHQYRQAMAWQMMAYNQPPHLSFFLGEMEGITVAPPPLTIEGRTSIGNGATITTANNGQHLLMTGYDNMSVNVGEGAQPKILTVNAPVWVKGNDNNNNITTTTYQHTISGAALTGDMRLIKQGWGQLILSDNTHTYTGPTEVWQGALTFNGTLSNSPLWLNRLTSLNSSGGTFSTISAEYGASINIGGATSNVSSVTVNELNLGFGSKVVFDISGNNVGDNDQLIVGVLNIEKKTDDAWVNFGPEYLAPRFWFNSPSTPTELVYPLGQIGELAEGCSLDDIILEGIDESRSPVLVIEDGILMLKLDGARPTVAPELALIDMVQTNLEDYPVESGPYYMPKVGMRAKSDKTTLSGYFTDTEGNITNLDPDMFETLKYSYDYEGDLEVTGWTNNTSNSIASDDTHGNYLNLAQGGGSGSRYAYTSFSANVDDIYRTEFDVAFHPAQGNYANNTLLLYGGNVPNIKDSWWEWLNNTDYVFRINGGANKGTTYTVEGDNNSFTLSDNAWYHFKVVVNKTTREVSYTVYSGSATLASGNYTVSDTNVQMGIHGMFISLGRNNSNAKIDNISMSNEEEPAFTFTRPGTLYLSASQSGYSDNTISMTVEVPYVIHYDSPDFSTIAAADAAATLGTDLWQTATSTGRWANWATGTYTFATANRQSQMYVDSDKVLWANIKSGHPGTRLLQLVEGFGLGQNVGSGSDADINEGTVFHAAGLGDEKTIIYHRYDLSRGFAKNYLSEFLNADENGNYDFDCGSNFTLQKFTAYKPYEGFLLGDANGDGQVTVTDVMLTVNYILTGNIDKFMFRNADVNMDNKISVADIMGIVNILLQ